MKKRFEVHFLDVGQGSSSVILFENYREGRNEAIIIDCGPDPVVLLRLLARFDTHIRALILTHNHADHVGGAQTLINHYGPRKRISRIYVVNDGTEGAKRLGEFLTKLEDAGRLQADVVDYIRPRVLFRSSFIDREHAERDGEALFEVEGLAPRPAQNLAARHAHDTCGVVRVVSGDQQVLFCGDSSPRIWKPLLRNFGRPFACEALTVPHHGGLMASRGGNKKVVEWFFQKAVQTKVAILSFSTWNQHHHPRREVIEAARGPGSGAQVLCTQLPSEFATNHTSLQEVLRATCFSQAGQPRRPTSAADSRGPLACGGSITLSLGEGGPQWGHQGEAVAERVCAFASLEHLGHAIRAHGAATNYIPPCHQDFGRPLP